MTASANIGRGLRGSQRGISLIELLVALAIAALLLLGLSQVFIGSKNTYRLQEGMSRVQENARFVTQYLEQNVRMAGYMGCGNDIDLLNKAGTPPSFLNHLRRLDSALGTVPLVQDTLTTQERFQRPIEGFTYTGASISDAEVGSAALSDWTPALPADAGFDTTLAQGSDVLMLRIVSDESTPMNGNFDMTTGSFSVTDPTFVEQNKIYAITNCSNARIFKASPRAAGSNPVIAGFDLNKLQLVTTVPSTWTGTFANLQFNQAGNILNAEVHRAEYRALYVGLRPDPVNGNVPVLKVVSDNGAVDELADNVEVMRIWYGVDTNGDGAVDKYVKANEAPLDDVSSKNARDAAWRKVLSVRIALLMRSQDRASVAAHTGVVAHDNVFNLFDSPLKRRDDSRFRDVYTTTIALRNRLGNY